MKRLSRTGGLALALGALFTLGAAIPQKDEAKPTFDPDAKAKTVIDDAITLAAKKHRRVLVVWGNEESGSDRDLYTALRRGKTADWPFYYEYVITPVHRGEKTSELAKSLGAPDADGAFLTILDAKGKPLENVVASTYLDYQGWDTARLGKFLAKHIVEPLDAEEVMKEALARATKENKRLFVHLGAPW